MRKLLAAFLLCFAGVASAQLVVEVTGAGAQRIPISIAPLAGEGALAQSISGIVRADLERSGLFRMIEAPAANPPLTEAASVNFAEWRARQADALVLGSVAARPDGRFEVRFKLFDTNKSADLSGVAYTMSRAQARATAHRIADYVYEKLTGEKGVFSTRIAYVVKRGNRYELQIADADGAGEETALASFEPIVSPSWSPDGRRLAYVSFENKKPVVYVHTLADGKLQGLELRAGLVAGRLQAGGFPVARGRLADIHGQSGRQQRAAHHPIRRHRHGTGFLPGRSKHLFHLRPRRQPPDLPHASRRRRGAESDVRRQLQRVAAHQPERPGACLYLPQ